MSEAKQTIREPIKVLASFDRTKIGIHLFFWNGRAYKVRKINLFHIERDSDLKIYHFAVTDSNGNCYQISFNPTSLKWQLEDVINI